VQLDFSVNRPQWLSRYWITAEALARRLTITQRPLGPRRAFGIRGRAGFPALFLEQVQAVFACLDAHSTVWLRRDDAPATPPHTVDAVPAADAPRDGARLLASFESDLRNLHEILSRIVRPDTLAALHAAAAATDPGPRLIDTLWAGAVAEFLIAYRHNVIMREHVIQALLPLYMARTGTFLFEYGASSGEAVEAAVEQLCAEFERVKPQIVQGWSEPAVR
jgi:hypothetical protein